MGPFDSIRIHVLVIRLTILIRTHYASFVHNVMQTCHEKIWHYNSFSSILLFSSYRFCDYWCTPVAAWVVLGKKISREFFRFMVCYVRSEGRRVAFPAISSVFATFWLKSNSWFRFFSSSILQRAFFEFMLTLLSRSKRTTWKKSKTPQQLPVCVWGRGDCKFWKRLNVPSKR